MDNTPDIDIRPDHWKIVQGILQEHVPQYEVWAFGSRAKWTAKEFSDLDLAIMTDASLPKEISAALTDAFDESDLPYKVDVVDWTAIDNSFQKIIKQQKVNLRNSHTKCGAILGTLDDKIQLNRRMNETLESMARAIFKDWFVDFGPVRAKAEGRQPEGIRADIASFFPSSFSSEGIPEGWDKLKLGSIAGIFNRGVAPDALPPDTPYIGLEHMPKASISLDKWETSSKIHSAKMQFNSGDILFGKLRPYFHKVGIAPVSGVCSSDILVIRPNTENLKEFVLLLVSSHDFIDYATRTSTGTKMPGTSWAIMSRFLTAIPGDDFLLNEFSALVAPMIEKITHTTQLSIRLSQLRDALLPKLVSGELRIKDAEKFVTEAV